MTTDTAKWKFLQQGPNGTIVSIRDESEWTIGTWRSVTEPVEVCFSGFHCSPTPWQAMSCVHGDVVARVEVAGTSSQFGGKSAHQHMRIIQAWPWRREDSTRLAIFVAEQALPHYESRFPGDTRIQATITAAKAALNNSSPTTIQAGHEAYHVAREASEQAREAGFYDAGYAAFAAAAAVSVAIGDYVHPTSPAVSAIDYAFYSTPIGQIAALKRRIGEWMVAYIETLPELVAPEA